MFSPDVAYRVVTAKKQTMCGAGALKSHVCCFRRGLAVFARTMLTRTPDRATALSGPHSPRRRSLAVAVVAALVASGVGLGATAAQAAPGDGSRAHGQFLSGSLLSALPLSTIAELEGAIAQSAGVVDHTEVDSLDLSLLDAIDLPLPSGLQVPIDVVDAGVISQWGQAMSDGSATAASGLISDTGGIGVGPVDRDEPTALSFDLTQLLGDEITASIADASLELGALSSRAESTGTTPSGTYRITGAHLVIDSPTIGSLSTAIQSAVSAQVGVQVGTVQSGLVDEIEAAIPLLQVGTATVGVTADTAGPIAALLDQTLGAGGPIEIDLASGQIDVDLSQLLESAANQGLNGLPLSTEVLSPAVLTRITDGVAALITPLVASIGTVVTAALNAATVSVNVRVLSLVGVPLADVTVDGTVAQVVGGTATSNIALIGINPCLLLGPLCTTLGSVVGAAVGGLLSTDLLGGPATSLITTAVTGVVNPTLTGLTGAFDAIGTLVSLSANEQTTTIVASGERFTQTALRLSVLPAATGLPGGLLRAAAPGVLELNMAESTVGPYEAPVPTASALAPVRGPETGGTEVTITGSEFTDATEVLFGSVPATSFTIDSPTSIRATTPAQAPGTVDVTVTTPGGTTAPLPFEYFPVTQVTAISPASGPIAGSQVVTITGTGFTGATAVSFGTLPALEFTVLSPTSISATTPSSPAGIVDVSVTVPGEAGTGVLVDGYAFVTPDAPTITSIAPTSGPQTGGTSVTITGTDLLAATAVTFDGLPGTITAQTATTITVTSPAHAPGPVNVVVEHPDGDSAPGTFTYTPVTQVDAISPAEGSAAGGTPVTITGQCFTGATDVLFGGVSAASFTIVDDTTITAVTPAGSGPSDVTVVAGGTCGSGTLPAGFTFVPAPAIAEITPTRGPTTGGTSVTIDGTGFTGVTAVTFAGVAGTIVSQTATQIVVESPANPVGVIDLVLVHPLGDSAPVDFEYFGITTITGVAPTEGSSLGGTVVTITGTCFVAGQTTVAFGGTPGTGVTVTSPTSLAVVAPAGSGLVDVVVTTPGECGTATAPDAFAFVAPDAPDITGLTPASGPQTGGTPVSVDGVRFTGAAAVTVDGVDVPFTVVSDELITFTTAAHDPGQVNVIVEHPSGDSAPARFDFTPVAQISSVSPASGPERGGTSVTLSGQCFTGATAVTVGGVPATYVIASDTSIVLETPPGVGSAPIVVTGGGVCGSATSPTPFTYLASPSVSSLVPDSGTVRGGTPVRIEGIGFTGATAVTFAGVAGTLFSVESDTVITVTSPANPAGAAALVVRHPVADAVPVAFTYIPDPAISTITPETGPEIGGTIVDLTGTGFLGATAVSFDGTDGTDFEVLSDTEIRVTTPPGTPGGADVVVRHPVGDSVAGEFTYLATPPSIVTLTPDAGPQTGGTAVSISGSDFTGATGVTFDGIAGTDFVVNDDASITVTSPVHAPGGAPVVVQSPAGASAAAPFRYFAVAVIASLAPGSGPVTGGTDVVITGIGFLGATSVTFDGAAGAAFSVVSDTEILVTSPAGTAGLADVRVLSADTASAPLPFTYTVPGQPTISGLTPSSGLVTGGEEVVITGSEFTGTTAVTFDGADVAFTVDSDTQITATTLAHPAGVVDVVVEHPVADSPAASYEFLALPPTVSGLAPDEGPVGGGTEVVIAGTDLLGASGVTFDGVSAAFTVDSSTRITAIAPPHAVGPVDVIVTHPRGDTAPADFTYVAATSITGVSPASGPEAGGTSVVISGTSLTGATAVLVDGLPTTSFTVDSDAQITAIVPAGSGLVDVSVVAPLGTATATDAYAYVAPGAPDAAAIAPATGPVAGGTIVTITGTGFLGATGVTFDGLAAAVTVDSDTQLTVVSPPHAAGAVNVVVQHPLGDAAPLVYTYTAVTTIDGVSPPQGFEEGGQTVVISGTCFTGATDVRFGATSAASFTVDSDTRITAVTPPGVGTVDVTVVGTPVCGTVSLPGGFEFVESGTPIITTLDPARGPETGGTAVTIRGFGLRDLRTVTFGGVQGTMLNAVSDTEATVVTPANDPGVVDAVGGYEGGTTAAFAFEYFQATGITGVTPGSGGTGTEVTITGDCFTGATAVRFGTTDASYRVLSDTTIVATAPAGSGTVDVSVVGAGECGTAVVDDAFRYTTTSVAGLASTGATPGLAFLIGLLLLLGGALAIGRGRRA